MLGGKFFSALDFHLLQRYLSALLGGSIMTRFSLILLCALTQICWTGDEAYYDIAPPAWLAFEEKPALLEKPVSQQGKIRAAGLSSSSQVTGAHPVLTPSPFLPQSGSVSTAQGLVTNPATGSIRSPFKLKKLLRSSYDGKKYEEAIHFAQQLIEINQASKETWYKMAYAFRRLKMYEDSLSAYDQVLQLNPRFRDGWYDRGVVLTKLKRLEEAITSYDKALELNQRAHWIHYDRAVLLKRLRRFPEAIQGLLKALELKPKYSWAYLELANIYFFKSQYVHALKYYQKVEELKPDTKGVAQYIKICKQQLEL